VWATRHLPQNRDVFVTCGGDGSVNLWKYGYPSQRSVKDHDGHMKGVMGSVTELQSKTFTTQPVASFDWSPDKEGLCVMVSYDQSLRVCVVTKLNKL
jgi:WD40 repeat protein